MEQMDKLYQAWLANEIEETLEDMEEDDCFDLREIIADSDNYKELAETFRDMTTDDDKQEIKEYLLGCDFGWDDKANEMECKISDPCYYWIQFKVDGENWTSIEDEWREKFN